MMPAYDIYLDSDCQSDYQLPDALELGAEPVAIVVESLLTPSSLEKDG